jgi:hypothetical protein
MQVLLISKHASENCPMFNEKARKLYMEYMSKRDGLLKKHGIKEIGWWNVHLEHLIVSVWDIPSLEAFQKFTMEPEFLALTAFSTYEMKMANTLAEVKEILQKAK